MGAATCTKPCEADSVCDFLLGGPCYNGPPFFVSVARIPDANSYKEDSDPRRCSRRLSVGANASRLPSFVQLRVFLALDHSQRTLQYPQGYPTALSVVQSWEPGILLALRWLHRGAISCRPVDLAADGPPCCRRNRHSGGYPARRHSVGCVDPSARGLSSFHSSLDLDSISRRLAGRNWTAAKA